MHKRLIHVVLLALLSIVSAAWSLERFPPPDFETDYTMPQTTAPGTRAVWMEYADSAVLLGVLCLTVVLVYKKCCRKGIFGLMVFSLIYFGFVRKGCICSIGAIGNVTLTVFHADYVMPISAILFFILPLVFALFFGGLLRSGLSVGSDSGSGSDSPDPNPRGLEHGLRMLAYVYLGLAVLMAGTGSVFIICRYDPFIGFFRFGANIHILVLGSAMLLIGVFIARPYCRFLCPYGVILRLLSRFSWKRVTITPAECVKCRLCEDACPFNAIDKPTADWSADQSAVDKKLLTRLLPLVPVLMIGLGWAFARMSPALSRAHYKVRLADEVAVTVPDPLDLSHTMEAYSHSGQTREDLQAEVAVIQDQFRKGGWILGVFLGLIFSVKLIGITIHRRRVDYEAHRGGCVACGRCYAYCPVGHNITKTENGMTNG